MQDPINRKHESAKNVMPKAFRRHAPLSLKYFVSRWYWRGLDAVDYIAEVSGKLPSHSIRCLIYRKLLHISIGDGTSIHRDCRFYRPSGVSIGAHTIVNRDVLLDGRMGLQIGSNVSISEGCMLLTLEHDPQSASFERRGAPTQVSDRVFVGARALILPGVTVGEGAVIAAGAVVSKDISPYLIVGGIPAKPIGQRRSDLSYELTYRKFLG